MHPETVTIETQVRVPKYRTAGLQDCSCTAETPLEPVTSKGTVWLLLVKASDWIYELNDTVDIPSFELLF